jgi:hypothetical protein
MVPAFRPETIHPAISARAFSPLRLLSRAFLPCAFFPRALIACALLLCAPAGAKTLERFNLSAGAGGTLSVPNLWLGESLGNGFVFFGPGADLFENRLSVQLDFGVSNAVTQSSSFEYAYDRYEPLRDTLFRSEYQITYRDDETLGLISYTGALNFGRWSFYGGSLVLMRLIEVERTGTEYRSFALGDSLDGFERLDAKPIYERFRIGTGNVLALYGAARRFGRVSVFVQGVALISIQAGVRVALRPLGKVGSHAGQ